MRVGFGEAAYEAFLGSELLVSHVAVGDLDRLFACLIPDNIATLVVAVTSGRAGLADESHACLNDLGWEHPAAVAAFLRIETPPEATTALTVETHPYTIELFDCLTTGEKVEVTVHMWSELGAYELSGKELLTAFTE